MTGCRPPVISSARLSSTTGRTQPRRCATSASAASASSAATARAVRRSASACAATRARISTKSSNSSAGHALLRAQRAALVLLELGGDVALRAHQGLPAHVVGGNLGRVRVAHLDGVAEDAVEAHAQRGDAGARALAALQRGDPRLRVPGGAAQLGEVGAPGLPDEPALPELPRRLVLQRLLEEPRQVGQGRHVRGEVGAERRAPAGPASRAAAGSPRETRAARPGRAHARRPARRDWPGARCRRCPRGARGAPRGPPARRRARPPPPGAA